MTLKELCEKTGLTAGNIEFYRNAGIISLLGKPDEETQITEEECENIKKTAVLRRTGMSFEDIKSLQKGEITLEEAIGNISRDSATVSTDMICAKLLEDGNTYDDIHADYMLMVIANEKASGGKLKDLSADQDNSKAGRRSLAAFIAVGILLLFMNIAPGKLDMRYSMLFIGAIIIMWVWMTLSATIERTEFPEKAAPHKRMLNIITAVLLAAVVIVMIFLP